MKLLRMLACALAIAMMLCAYAESDAPDLAGLTDGCEMALVCFLAPEDEAAFLAAAQRENLEAYRVAVVTEEPRMVMRWRGKTIVDLSRAFLDTNGAAKHAAVSAGAPAGETPKAPATLREMAGSL